MLTRSGLRDVVILLSLGSACLFHASVTAIVVSLVLLEAGCLVHVVSKGVLIRNEVLCKDGIYSIVRHPYYLANYLIDTSFCVASGNPYLVLLYPFLFFWSYGPTFRQEEATLAGRHGEAALAHLLGTPGVFPDRHSIFRIGHLFEGFSGSRLSAKEVGRNIRFHAMWLLILTFNLARWDDVKAIGRGGRPYVPAACVLAVLVLYAASVLIIRKGRARHAGKG
ncbi:MAG: hypothetical protein ABSC19_03970 [Syntrophorhabdales bacterium]